jgi:hypothetical protein
MAIDWNEKEVSIIVKDYFEMLQIELNRAKYNKSTHRNILLPRLESRSEGSIEFKHQNISAVLAEMGLPFIKGYKPRSNYQQLLMDEVSKYLSANKEELEKDFRRFSEEIINPDKTPSPNFESLLTSEPESSILNEREPSYRPIKINYLQKEQNNRNLGENGERLIFEYEKWRLRNAGKDNLADKIEWISKELGMVQASISCQKI